MAHLACSPALPSSATKICIKYVLETLKKLYEFSIVWADRADLGSTKTAMQQLKYASFEVSFFYVFMGKK